MPLRRARMPATPPPTALADRFFGWGGRTFLRNPVHPIAALDFFTVHTITFPILFCFLILRHDRRHVVPFNVTAHPTAEWAAPQVAEAFPFDTAPQFLRRDRDAIDEPMDPEQAHKVARTMTFVGPGKGFGRGRVTSFHGQKDKDKDTVAAPGQKISLRDLLSPGFCCILSMLLSPPSWCLGLSGARGSVTSRSYGQGCDGGHNIHSRLRAVNGRFLCECGGAF